MTNKTLNIEQFKTSFTNCTISYDNKLLSSIIWRYPHAKSIEDRMETLRYECKGVSTNKLTNTTLPTLETNHNWKNKEYTYSSDNPDNKHQSVIQEFADAIKKDIVEKFNPEKVIFNYVNNNIAQGYESVNLLAENSYKPYSIWLRAGKVKELDIKEQALSEGGCPTDYTKVSVRLVNKQPFISCLRNDQIEQKVYDEMYPVDNKCAAGYVKTSLRLSDQKPFVSCVNEKLIDPKINHNQELYPVDGKCLDGFVMLQMFYGEIKDGINSTVSEQDKKIDVCYTEQYVNQLMGKSPIFYEIVES